MAQRHGEKETVSLILIFHLLIQLGFKLFTICNIINYVFFCQNIQNTTGACATKRLQTRLQINICTFSFLISSNV